MKAGERIHPARILQTRTGVMYMFVLAPHKLRTNKEKMNTVHLITTQMFKKISQSQSRFYIQQPLISMQRKYFLF